jgi:hypothetical protein
LGNFTEFFLPLTSVSSITLPFHIFERNTITMGNLLIIDGAASGQPKRRHDVTFHVDIAPWKRLCTFFYRIYPNENIVNTGVMPIFHTKNDDILRTLHLRPDVIGFDKIQPKQVGHFGTRIN